MRIATLAYLPPTAEKGYGKVFLDNINDWKAKYSILLYTDSPEYDVGIKIPKPGETVMYRNTPISINNLVFLRALEIAIKNQVDYFLYLEEDCRVMGDNWDEILFEEFFKHKEPLIGGTPSIWNQGLCGAKSAIAAIEFSHKVVKKTGRPPLVWQAGGTNRPIGLWVYPNGAIGIYHTATVAAIFNGWQYSIGDFAVNMFAWDCLVGCGMTNQFGDEAFGKFAVLKSSYSGYKDYAYTLPERIKMLESGEVVAVHQVKSQWKPGKSEQL